MAKVQVRIPPKLVPLFTGPADVRASYGGRGSAKTVTFAKMTAIRALMWARAGVSGIVLCGRQFMNSLSDSSMEEIKAAIRSETWLEPFFEIGEKYIRTNARLPGRIDYAFAGLDRNIDSIKSKSRIMLCWVDEAETVSEEAWAKLIPTIRQDGSELWVTWNPESDESPTHRRFRVANDPLMKVVEMSWRDNPWFPHKLNRDRLRDQKDRPDTYDWIWEGDFKSISDAQVLKGRFKVEDFTPQPGWQGPYYGADWGYSVDPTAVVRCWIFQRRLYVDFEAFGHEVSIFDLPKLFDKVPGAKDHVCRADNSRPETIDAMKKQGYPRVTACEKWPGSVEDGVEHLRSYEQIVIHPRCPAIAREARLWSYKTDRLTKDVLPKLADGNDHGWDAVRYALTPMIQRRHAPRVAHLGHMAR